MDYFSILLFVLCVLFIVLWLFVLLRSVVSITGHLPLDSALY
jgi:hypothetical protein